MTPYELSFIMRMYYKKERNTLNDLHACVYGAVIQSRSKKRYKPLIKNSPKIKKTTVKERDENFKFFEKFSNHGGEIGDQLRDTKTYN